MPAKSSYSSTNARPWTEARVCAACDVPHDCHGCHDSTVGVPGALCGRCGEVRYEDATPAPVVATVESLGSTA